MPMSKKLESKDGKPIDVGDSVWTRFRGGKREGEVEAVIADKKDLESAGDLGVNVQNPPKVVFKDQHGHTVSHNPGTLTHTEASGQC